MTHFPRLSLSEIREELYAGNDMVVSPFEDEFDEFSKAVLSSVRRAGRCTERQADVLCSACQVAFMRIVRRAQESA